MTMVRNHIIPLLLLAASLFAGVPQFVEDQAIIRFESHLNRGDMELVLEDHNLLDLRIISRPLNLVVITLDIKQKALHQALRDIRSEPEVLYIQRNHLVAQRNTPDDPLFDQQWNFHNTGQGGGVIDADVDAPEAWEITTGGTTVLGHQIVAAVVDGGCDLEHPDLLANLWTNPADSAGNGIDDDNNGWVDDSLGWNAFGHNGNVPTNSHGTHVAGTVGAHSNNGNQVAGVNWSIKLMNIAGGSTNTSIAMEAYSYVLEQKLAWIETGGLEGAFVVSSNSSFGIDFADCESGDYPVWNDMYNAMGEAGILSVGATANRNTNVDVLGDVPTGCSSPYMVAVTNTTRNDTKASSGYGLETIDLGAPGTSILSTNYFQGTSLKTGTSMAAPHVTGAIALMHAAANEDLAQYYQEDMALGAAMFKHLLLKSVDGISALDGITVTGGRLNLHNAVLEARDWFPPGNGNMNFDAVINIQDIIILTQLIIGNAEPSSALLAEGDLNGDDQVTVQDLVLLIQDVLQ